MKRIGPEHKVEIRRVRVVPSSRSRSLRPNRVSNLGSSDDGIDQSKQSIRIARLVNGHIGMRVRLRRLEQGLSRRAISARIKFPVVKVAQLESGAVELTIGQLIRLAKMLKVPPAYFYAGLPTESRDRRRSN